MLSTCPGLERHGALTSTPRVKVRIDHPGGEILHNRGLWGRLIDQAPNPCPEWLVR